MDSHFINEREGELAERILKRAPKNITRIQFVNSGSEALRFICCIPHNQNPSSAAEAPRCDQ